MATRPPIHTSSTHVRVPISQLLHDPKNVVAREPDKTKSCETGALSAGDTPVPIPNTVVKTRSGDDTLLGESSTVPDYSKRLVNASLFGVWEAVHPKSLQISHLSYI